MNRTAATATLLLVLLMVIGSAAQAPDEDTAKVIIVIIGMHEDRAEPESVEIFYGQPPNLGLQHGEFTATVRARNGTALYTFSVGDPRLGFDDAGLRDELERLLNAQRADREKNEPGREATDNIDLPLIVPYAPDIGTIDLADTRSGIVLASVDTTPATEAFRKQYPRDPDMQALSRVEDAGTSPGTMVGAAFFLVAGVLATLLLALLAGLVRKSRM